MLRACLIVGLVVMFVAVRAEMEMEQQDKLMKAFEKKEKNEVTAKIIGSQLEKGIVLSEDEDGSTYELKWEAGEENLPRIYRIDKDGEVVVLVHHERQRQKRGFWSDIGDWAWETVKDKGKEIIKDGVNDWIDRW